VRLNIYVPEKLAGEVRQHRRLLNFSQICVDALRDAIESMQSLRDAGNVLARLYQGSTPAEARLERRLRLRKCVISRAEENLSPHEAIARTAAWLLDALIADGVQVAIGGGKQMWAMTRELRPRRAHLELSALGFGLVDAEQPHVHANALVTLLSLLYAPRSRAVLTGSPQLASSWETMAPVSTEPHAPVTRVIVGTCAPFRRDSAYARLLGDELADYLLEEQVIGEYLGVFLTADGRLLEPYMPKHVVGLLGVTTLRVHAARADTMVVLLSKSERLELAARVAQAGLCNVVVTDSGAEKMVR
jgi:DNA-binding transcriptional regulator LsrR (DeoR family)